MKKLLLIVTVLLLTVSVQAQDKTPVKKNKNAKAAFIVDGICGMCKKRIETAALKTKGVKFAVWDVKSHQINVILDERKTNLKTLKTNIANVGHDSEGFTASDKAYNSVHPCCKYRDTKIILQHEGESLKKVKTN